MALGSAPMPIRTKSMMPGCWRIWMSALIVMALPVSEYHGLYECESCHCLFDCYGNVWADGEF